jgi:hypothetical protein
MVISAHPRGFAILNQQSGNTINREIGEHRML